MSMQIHPTAIVEEGARLGAGCEILAHAVIGRNCQLGDGVVVHPFAVVGGDPQDLSFDAKVQSGVRIGARTVIREHVTISRATRPGECTEVGADCFLMASSHVAHDCQIGSAVVIANAALLAGHVHVGERAFLGGGAVIHQFCRIGESAMIGGGARISGDVPPFCMATERNELIGLNVVGLRRRGFSRQAIAELRRALHVVCRPVGNPRQLAAQLLEGGEYQTDEARRFLVFFGAGRRQPVRRRANRSDNRSEPLGEADA
ncbi:MAG TPA: acyl-ACP--UDP-N-acetylglucosamine O-acyltransferase [Steroidobacteraceae bacterium]|jgi:UDP-N-acetylglucosamine acyltransferase|nr:acyl-ACP--UDP-N-acetylglucosamine O-acyltransferase [Steroidobacteraceae bacterium]